MGLRSKRASDRRSKQKQQNTIIKEEDNLSTTTTSIEDLPWDIVRNIIKRLPTFSLLQVKLVSTSRYIDILTSDIQVSKNPSLLLLSSDLKQSSYLYDKGDILIRITPPKRSFLGKIENALSSNGLLCLLSPRKDKYRHYRVCIYNPLVRDHVVLPDYQLPKEIEHIYQHFGFGYNPETEEYKVVRVCGSLGMLYSGRFLPTAYNFAKVLTVGETASWRSVIGEPPPIYFEESSDIVLRGAIHWICRREDVRSSLADHEDQRRVVVSFDVGKEEFYEIQTPDAIKGGVLSVLGACLAVSVQKKTRVDVWVMKAYGVMESWIKKYVLEKFGIPQRVRNGGELFPIYLLDNGDVLCCYGNIILSYNPQDMKFEIVADTSWLPHYLKAVKYNPILNSPF